MSSARPRAERRPAAPCSCRHRHSPGERAPTPAGSKCCRWHSAIVSSSQRRPRPRAGQAAARDLLERLREVAVLVERVDQQLDEGAVALVEVGERELRAQVVAQRRRVGRGEAAVAVLLVVARAAPVRGDLARPVGSSAGGGLGRRAALVRGGIRRRRRPLRCSAAFVAVLALERRVLHQEAVDLLVELDRGELQQPDRLLQLRREREVLR